MILVIPQSEHHLKAVPFSPAKALLGRTFPTVEAAWTTLTQEHNDGLPSYLTKFTPSYNKATLHPTPVFTPHHSWDDLTPIQAHLHLHPFSSKHHAEMALHQLNLTTTHCITRDLYIRTSRTPLVSQTERAEARALKEGTLPLEHLSRIAISLSEHTYKLHADDGNEGRTPWRDNRYLSGGGGWGSRISKTDAHHNSIRRITNLIPYLRAHRFPPNTDPAYKSSLITILPYLKNHKDNLSLRRLLLSEHRRLTRKSRKSNKEPHHVEA